MIQDFLKNAAIYGLGKIVMLMAGLIILPVITTTLTPRDYGVFDLLNLCLIILNLSVAMEVSQALARYIGEAGDASERRLFVSTGYWFTIIMYGLASTFIFVLREPISNVLFNDDSFAPYIILLIPWLFLHGTHTFISNQFRWENKPQQHAVLQIILAFSLIGFVLLFLWGMPVLPALDGLLYAYLFSLMIAVTFGFVFIIRQRMLDFSFSIQKLRLMLVFSSPLVLSSLAVFLQNYIDRIMISQLLDLESLGLYSLAFRIASVLMIVAGIFQLSLVPLIYKHHKDKDAPIKFAETANLYLFCTLSILMGISLFSPELFYLFIGEGYTDAITIIPLLLSAIVFQTFQTFAPGLHIAKKTSLVAVINAVGMALNFILNFIFIAFYGLNGAAIATLISAIIMTCVHIFISQRYFKITYHYVRLIACVVVSCGGMIALSMVEYNLSYVIAILKIIGYLNIVLVLGMILIPHDIKDKIVLRLS